MYITLTHSILVNIYHVECEKIKYVLEMRQLFGMICIKPIIMKLFLLRDENLHLNFRAVIFILLR